MSNESEMTTPETQQNPAAKPGKGGLLFAVGMAIALILLVALNMG